MAYCCATSGKYDRGIGHCRNPGVGHFFDGRCLQRFFQKYLRGLGTVNRNSLSSHFHPVQNHESGKRTGGARSR